MNALQVISECMRHKHTSLELRECDLRDTDLAWALLAACLQLTELQLWQSTGITSIRILEQLPNLEILHLELLRDVDLSVLQKLPKLKHLYLSGLTCNVLAELQALTQLELLHLSRTYDEDVEDDFSFMASLVNLKELRLGFCSLKDIDFLPPLKNLEKLILKFNMLEDISPISQFENLTYLDISYNHILDISPLLALPLLESLSSYDNPIKVCPPAPIVHFLGQMQDKNLPLKDFLLQREPPQIEQIWQFLATGEEENIFLAEQLAIAADWTEEELRVYTKFAEHHLQKG